MATPARVIGHRLGSRTADIQIEMFLDLSCPFSKKMFKTVVNSVYPAIEATHPGVVSFLDMSVPQPWHPQSSILHECALAAEAVDPCKYFDYANAVYDGISAVRVCYKFCNYY